jgi:hypothetical protein
MIYKLIAIPTSEEAQLTPELRLLLGCL